MTRKIAVVVIHGTGGGYPGYSAAFLRSVIRELPREMRNDVSFGEVCWGDVVRGQQNRFFMRAQEMGFYYPAARRFLMSLIGDVAAYRKPYRRDNTPYFAIQDRITAALAQLDEARTPDQALIFCGHSLGCHILSTYIWDIGRLRDASPAERETLEARGFGAQLKMIEEGSPFVRLETLAGLFTFGNLAPLFVTGFPQDTVVPLNVERPGGKAPLFPGAKLSAPMRERAQWTNITSTFDSFAFPLKPISRAYQDDPRVIDIVLPPTLSLLRPSAFQGYSEYWSRRGVARRLALQIEGLMREGGVASPTARAPAEA